MSSFKRSCSFLILIFSTVFLFSNITAFPIDNPYNEFIDFLVKNNCSMPAVEPPFPPTTLTESQSNFSYLSEPLKECQTSNAAKKDQEAMFLCSEVFDVLGNISCSGYNTQLPKIKVPLSQDVCNDFKSMHDLFPKGEEFLSGKLVDGTLCKLLCSKDYELLCKTLIWSYGVQAKIKSFLENLIVSDDADGNKNVVSKPGVASVKVSLAEDNQSPSKEITNEMTDNSINSEGTVAENKKTVPDLSSLSDKLSILGVSRILVPNQDTSSKIVSLTNDTLNETNVKTTSKPKDMKVRVVPKNESESVDGKVSSDSIQPVTQNQTPHHKEDEVNVNSDLNIATEGVDRTPVNPDTNANSLKPESSSVTDKDRKTTSLNNISDKEKPTDVKSNTEPGTSVSSISFVSQSNGMDNELNNVDLDGEAKEGKVKQTNIPTDDKKKTEKPKLTDFETSLESDVDLKQLESTTLQILPARDEDVEPQEDKEQDQYNDTENDGDYPKEYENSFNPPVKSKETSVKSSIIEETNQMSKNYDILVSSRNNIGRIPDDSRIISAFPEQEDSHFFFYFLSIVLILMAGYLIFHNKQKIIALIVEGRHERRRRSHGAGYKKLETK